METPEPEGSAYDRPAPRHDPVLTEVGRGTPGGEWLRRYWHPIALAGDASARSRMVRVLGEDLILFRDGHGRAGLLYPRCCHRGASLYYGRGEKLGIRCCYHGWLFDVEGRCLDQPCEPEGGRQRHRVRQPWYPLEERYGLIFAYLGPLDRKPVLPRYDILEELEPDEELQADDTGIGSGGAALVPCNWLQHFENVMDPLHVPILHGSFSGLQFAPQMGIMPQVNFAPTPRGVRSFQDRRLPDGGLHHRVTEVVLPTLRVVPSPKVERYGRCEQIGWVLPIDDTNFRIYVVGRVNKGGPPLGSARSKFNGKFWWEMSEAEHQQFPGDFECQVSQGPITFHSEERLVSSDKGVAMLRRQILRQIESVRDGGDPMGVTRDPAHALVRLEAGNFLRPAETTP
jgi:nitrite reductase/ring-hydroxylating ferredoxin subunit